MFKIFGLHSSQKLFVLGLSLFYFAVAKAEDVDTDIAAIRPMPQFKSPYANLSEAEIEQKVTPLQAQSNALSESQTLDAQVARSPEHALAAVEIVLPKNRCESGWLRWGSQETGYQKCRVLGRGESVFASLKDLAGLRATQRKYRNWQIGQTSAVISAQWIKNKEHFATATQYDHCMYRPDTQSNGATIYARPNSTIGQYLLDTGEGIHPGKGKWGTVPGEKKFLLPVRMNKILSPENRRYRDQNDLVGRYDFWLHSHEASKDEAPLEALSTWGCPRMSRSCQEEFQIWVAAENEAGRKPLLLVVEDDVRAYQFDEQ